jgi:transcription antitermination factor NusG
MATVSNALWHPGSLPEQTSPELLPRWYAAYTSAHCEKKTAAEILRRGVESFLPLYRSVRRWSDRRVELDLPLFPGYVFVRLALQDRLKVLQVPGVARLVGFGGSPVALPEEQIAVLRAGLGGRSSATPHPYLQLGRRVRIVRGPLCGASGILIRKKSVYRVVLSLDLIMRSVAVEVDSTDIQPIS